MIETNLFEQTDDRRIAAKRGCFSVIEYVLDSSVSLATATPAYFASKMGIHKQQVIANIENSTVVVQSGMLQWYVGEVESGLTAKGRTEVIKKIVSSRVMGEPSVKPKFSGTGLVALEPVFKNILLEDISDWGGELVIDDSMFLACEEGITLNSMPRSGLTAAVLSGEGSSGTYLSGSGIFALRSPVPRSELILMKLKDDAIRIDGSLAVAWTPDLQLSVERTVGNIVTSSASGEGTVNVFRGTGTVVMAPAAHSIGMVMP